MKGKEKAPQRGRKGQFKGNKSRAIIRILLKSIPLSRREISIKTGIEICSLCSPLLKLVDQDILEIPYTRHCRISGNPVYHYSMKEGGFKDGE